MILLAAIVSSFVDRDIAGIQVIAIMESYVPISGEMQLYIINVISAVIHSLSLSTRFAEVWAAPLCAAVLLRAAENLFIIYLEDLAKLNAVYGALGGIMALLLWIYVYGCVFIYGACLFAGQTEIRSLPEKMTVVQADKRDET